MRAHRVLCGVCGVWNTVGWLMEEGNGGRKCVNGPHAASFQLYNEEH